MKKSVVFVDDVNGEIVCSKTFLSKARVYGTDEYQYLRSVRKDNPDFKISVRNTNGKETYRGLGYDRMKLYIGTTPNPEDGLKDLESVRIIAKAKGAEYAITKKWFLATYPDYKGSDVAKEAINTVKNRKSSTHINPSAGKAIPFNKSNPEETKTAVSA